MARVNYYYDAASSQYKRVYSTFWEKLINILGITVLSVGIAIIMMIIYSTYFELPNEVKLKNEINALEFNYEKLDQEVSSLHTVIAVLENRDDEVYRVIVGADPIDVAIRNGGVGGAERYTSINTLNHNELIVNMFTKIEKLKRKIYVELKSQEEVFHIAENKQKQYACIPAIQPIANKQLKALASGFGKRIHPIYKVLKMHKGIDFSSPIGTPVYATADGEVVVAEEAAPGYGKMIMIDHGFNYKTRYGHLNDFTVKAGQRVKRGEQIGYVGNTGVSTAPHLHYEVLLQGIQINPVHYFFNDLNAEEYEKIVHLASIQNQSLGN
jgi:murein DD-endopeptidase MepM/ murein hydrolase activator NlpD